MSIIHINHVKNYLKTNFEGLIDMSDYSGKTDSEKEKCFLSRALAAYALTALSLCSNKDAAACVTDGYGDNGVDGIYYDKISKNLWIVQSKFIASGNSCISNGDMLKFIQGVNDLLNLSFESFNKKIKAYSEEIEDALNDSSVKIQIVNASTGLSLSKESSKSIKDFIDGLNDPTDLAFFYDFNLEKAHKALLGNVDGTPIDVDITLTDWGMIEDPYYAIYGLMSGSDLAAWWQTYHRRLFSENIRSFLGTSSEVNENISQTLKDSPENFVYFNNGITILCEELKKKPIGGGDRRIGSFSCKDISVVNGAQTIGTIGTLLGSSSVTESSVKVLVKFISLENAPEGLGEQITIATNTQNKVDKKDFVSLDSEQNRLKMEFALESITYHIKRTDEKIISDENNYTLEEATLSLATQADDVSYAVLAKREIGKLWEDRSRKPYVDLFNSNLTARKLIKTVKVYRKVSELLKAKSMKVDGRERSIYVYGNLFITHMVFRLIPEYVFDSETFPFDDFLNNQIEKEIHKMIKKVHDKTMRLYPTSMVPQLFRNYTKCRDIKTHIKVKLMQ